MSIVDKIREKMGRPERMYPGISEKGELGWVPESEVRAMVREQNEKTTQAAKNLREAEKIGASP